MDGSKGRPQLTAGLDLGDNAAISMLWTPTAATLRLKAAYAHSDRNENPLALG
jgi:hypothetical protein